MIVSSVSFIGSRLRYGVCLDRSLFEGSFKGLGAEVPEVPGFDSESMFVSISVSLRTSAGGIFLRFERTTTRLLCPVG